MPLSQPQPRTKEELQEAYDKIQLTIENNIQKTLRNLKTKSSSNFILEQWWANNLNHTLKSLDAACAKYKYNANNQDSKVTKKEELEAKINFIVAKIDEKTDKLFKRFDTIGAKNSFDSSIAEFNSLAKTLKITIKNNTSALNAANEIVIDNDSQTSTQVLKATLENQKENMTKAIQDNESDLEKVEKELQELNKSYQDIMDYVKEETPNPQDSNAYDLESFRARLTEMQTENKNLIQKLKKSLPSAKNSLQFKKYQLDQGYIQPTEQHLFIYRFQAEKTKQELEAALKRKEELSKCDKLLKLITTLEAITYNADLIHANMHDNADLILANMDDNDDMDLTETNAYISDTD